MSSSDDDFDVAPVQVAVAPPTLAPASPVAPGAAATRVDATDPFDALFVRQAPDRRDPTATAALAMPRRTAPEEGDRGDGSSSRRLIAHNPYSAQVLGPDLSPAELRCLGIPTAAPSSMQVRTVQQTDERTGHLPPPQLAATAHPQRLRATAEEQRPSAVNLAAAIRPAHPAPLRCTVFGCPCRVETKTMLEQVQLPPTIEFLSTAAWGASRQNHLQLKVWNLDERHQRQPQHIAAFLTLRGFPPSAVCTALTDSDGDPVPVPNRFSARDVKRITTYVRFTTFEEKLRVFQLNYRFQCWHLNGQFCVLEWTENVPYVMIDGHAEMPGPRIGGGRGPSGPIRFELFE